MFGRDSKAGRRIEKLYMGEREDFRRVYIYVCLHISQWLNTTEIPILLTRSPVGVSNRPYSLRMVKLPSQNVTCTVIDEGKREMEKHTGFHLPQPRSGTYYTSQDFGQS